MTYALSLLAVLCGPALLALAWCTYHRMTCPLCRFYKQKSSDSSKGAK